VISFAALDSLRVFAETFVPEVISRKEGVKPQRKTNPIT